MPVLPQVPIRYVERNRQKWADVTVHESDEIFIRPWNNPGPLTHNPTA